MFGAFKKIVWSSIDGSITDPYRLVAPREGFNAHFRPGTSNAEHAEGPNDRAGPDFGKFSKRPALCRRRWKSQ